MSTRALILDDSLSVRRVLAKILLSVGIESVQASDGADGLKLVEEQGGSLGLVLADWNMPGMDGIEFVRRFRAQAQYLHVPVIMVTTETEIAQMMEALAAGANEYLMKPFTPEMLAAKLRILQVTSA
jgi:two-component system chemotaxis response regulator CheY